MAKIATLESLQQYRNRHKYENTKFAEHGFSEEEDIPTLKDVNDEVLLKAKINVVSELPSTGNVGEFYATFEE